MSEKKLILLPVLDGTGKLFAPFVAVLPQSYSPSILTFPTDSFLDYNELLTQLGRAIEGQDQVILVAESFSGPLAVRFAARNPDRVKALVLCASFVRSPVGPTLSVIARALGKALFAIAPPDWAVRQWLLGRDSSDELVELAKSAIRGVEPAVLSRRLELVMKVDVRSQLRECKAPILYLKARRDALVGARSWKEIRELSEGITHSEIDGPHLLMQVRPQEVFNEIERFLEGK